MNLHITELPLRKLLKASKSSFNIDDTVQTVLDTLSQYTEIADRQLLIDRSILLAVITSKDPINQYYRGTVGDVYRIVDTNAVRYRRVGKGDMQQTQNKVNAAPAQDLLSSYYRAYETLITMLTDRQCTYMSSTDLASLRKTPAEIKSKLENISQLNIDHVKDRHGRSVHVVFMASENNILTTRQRAGIINGNAPLLSIIKELTQKYDLEDFEFDNEASLASYGKYADIIVIYNNPTNETISIEKTHSGTFLQFFSIQQLAFNITKHRDQPIFTLLDPIKDRKEIVDVYSLNGVILDPSKKLSDYKITSDTKLILI